MTSSERSDDGTDAPGDRARASAAGEFALLDALLNVAGDAPAWPALFSAARKVFGADGGMVLLAEGAVLRCVASDPAAADDAHWPATPALAQAMGSRVFVLPAGATGDGRALLPPDLLSPDQPALLIPIAAGGRHAALLM